MSSIALSPVKSQWLSATRLIFCLFILSIPWVKTELLQRLGLAEVLFGAFLFFLFLQMSTGQLKLYKSRLPSKDVFILFGLWLVALLLSGFGSTHVSQYLFESGGMVYLAITAIAIALIAAQSEQYFERIFKWARISVVIVVGVGALGMILQIVTGHYDPLFYNTARKLISTFKFPNQLAGFLVLFFPMIWEEAQGSGSWIRRLFYGALLIATFVCIVATGSRTGVAALVFCLGIYASIYLVRANFRMLIAGVIFLASFYFIVLLIDQHFGVINRALSVINTVTTQGEFTDPFRLMNWGVALQLFQKSPFLGYGLGNISVDYQYEIHNAYLSVVAEMGMIGAVAFALLFGYIIVTGIQNIRLATKLANSHWIAISRGIFIGFLTLLVYSTQQMMLRSRFLWLAIGLIIAAHVVLQLKLRYKEDVAKAQLKLAGGET
ncbi:O-antigen ligase family protein [Candidatus Acetothermia bacterium]|nr:O-antigen ligase family protein [Candidatus Acetothermia bacterium]MBI3643980.1 O-antigen ligase family protein [Candidatus Acetothermia bacterium]